MCMSIIFEFLLHISDITNVAYGQNILFNYFYMDINVNLLLDLYMDKPMWIAYVNLSFH